ncbi:hypothetical protein ELI44_36440 [Rhizobium ruizarguesonis]|nr:hypothetical protein ELI42_36525 [Rhizobium ruizarguesonis]TAU45983.1 hypothetical protein ELI44_36440 [Rhizobium ruizarguesonis]
MPVRETKWSGAHAYCFRRGDLPTERNWIVTAHASDGRLYPGDSSELNGRRTFTGG